VNILAAIKREERKLEKQLGQVRAQTNRSTSGCKSTGRLCGARSRRREEARFVGCWESGDYQGREEAVGGGQEAGKESNKIDLFSEPETLHRLLQWRGVDIERRVKAV
jgi:hypothetical protein